MANIPGGTGVLPGAFTDVITASRGVAIPGGTRIAAMIGEGSTDQTLVSQAQGSGGDGLDSTYSTVTGADGRHFLASNAPFNAGRTTLFKNGIPLVGTETLIDSNAFSSQFDYRIDISTGKIELQRAHLVDQGGIFYIALSCNVGVGSVNNLTLLDVNAPPETWTIRCVSVQRDAGNLPISNTAKFLAFGSVSGAKLDANGNPIVWMANNAVVSNGTISFSIQETVPAFPFREGDAFTIKVASGVLNRSDSLTINAIPSLFLNDPVLVQGMGDVVSRHGLPSVSNSLSLGAQLAFANSASVLITAQAAPAMPRRTSFVLDTDVNSTALDNDEFTFPLPVGVTPDFNSQIHFFVKNNATNVEKQVLPNKFTYYTLDTGGQPTTNTFIQDNAAAPAGNSYAYTVKQSFETLNFAADGYMARNPAFHNQGTFSSPSVIFDSTYVGKALKIIDSVNSSNLGLFNVTAVTNGSLYVVADGGIAAPATNFNSTWMSDFVNDTAVTFSVVNTFTRLSVAGAAGVDGVLTTSGPSTGTATLTSALISFTALI